MPRIGDFWTKHPNILLNINPSIQLVDLVADRYDMAIRYGEGDWPNLNSKRLLHGDFCVVARPDLLEGRDAICLDDVQGIPWLLEGSMMERTVLLESVGVNLSNAQVKTFTTNELVLSAVHAGLGMSLQTGALVRSQIASGALQNICDLAQDGLSYFVVTPKGNLHNDQKTFENWLFEMAA
jgi:LysR family glycine cleavage system transcriptional activator